MSIQRKSTFTSASNRVSKPSSSKSRLWRPDPTRRWRRSRFPSAWLSVWSWTADRPRARTHRATRTRNPVAETQSRGEASDPPKSAALRSASRAAEWPSMRHAPPVRGMTVRLVCSLACRTAGCWGLSRSRPRCLTWPPRRDRSPLTVTDESAQERRAQVMHAVHVVDDVRNGHSPHQAIDLTAHQSVLASEAGDGIGQPW